MEDPRGEHGQFPDLDWLRSQIARLRHWRRDLRVDQPGSHKAVHGKACYTRAAQWVHYVHVESLDRAVKQVLKLGALLRSKTAVPKTE